ncbi:TIGR04168 family protein [Neosynechococcus sphagnicola]|uniref:TIGR04168 family protein n=1 Tax=Neosynechococcus sphagnicola TaxID=1501145 RepID=UPI00068DF026|nr:TIGR04168 family protein [Neosynechococcus sphagnicola]
MPRSCQFPPTMKIAVVGDVHDLWDAADGDALAELGADLLLLVGDFGNEAVEVVRAIAALDIPKAVILGNHDAWYSASEWGMRQCPYNRTQEDRVQQQLDLLGGTHVGYGKLDFPSLNLTVVGARPFSWGGSVWKNVEFYQQRYGIGGFEESTACILNAAQRAHHNTLIFMGHCGPYGLGDRPEDPCGKDWQPIGGDHGDPDFTAAIAQTLELGKTIPLVVFGHMHHTLRHTKQVLRTPVHVGAESTVYLNAAAVPRVVRTAAGLRRNFSLVTLESGIVSQIALVWIDEQFKIVSEQVWFHRPYPLVPEPQSLGYSSYSLELGSRGS